MNVQPNRSAKFVIGVDLGGTNVRAAVVTKEGEIVGQARHPSAAKEGAARVVEQTVLTINEAIAVAKVTSADIGAVGMAVPGHIETKTGTIIWSPNFGATVDGIFRMTTDTPYTAPCAEALGIACFAGNDANIAALGEYRYGAGKFVNDMVMFTLGTGIGSGVISDDRLITGSTGGAVELGHHVIVAGGDPCGCGDFGHLEAYCGQGPIIRRGQRAMATGKDTLLHQKVAGYRPGLTPKLIDDAAKEDDQLAIQVFEETGYYLGIGIANAVNIFNPALVVIGGGIRNATGLLPAAERSWRAHAIASIARTCKLVEAALGEDAGVMGAAELAWRQVSGNA